MSENVELVRRAFEAALRRPEPDFAVVNELFDAEHEFVSRIEMLEGGSHRGISGYRAWRRMVDELADQHGHVDAVSAIDDTRVLLITPTSFRFRTSGLGLEDQRFGCVVTVRDGRIVRTEVYGSEDEAREAIASG